MSYVFFTTEDTEFHGVFICPPDGKFILRETLRYSVVSFIYDAKIIPRQSAMSVFVRYCPYLSGIVRICPLLSGNVRFSVKIIVNSLVEWWKIRIFKY